MNTIGAGDIIPTKSWEERKKCIFCNSTELTECIHTNTPLLSPLSFIFTEDDLSKEQSEQDIENKFFMPYNILICNNCNTTQTKYLADLHILYNTNHVDNYGTTKSQKFIEFSNFIKNNKDICGFIEVGTPHCDLANELLSTYKNTPYTIIEPSVIKPSSNITVIPSFLENVNIDNIPANTIIMSDVFEHFYEPLKILEKISNICEGSAEILSQSNIKYIYLNHPDFDYAIYNNNYLCLNAEHTYLIEHQFLFYLFEKYGFRLNEMKNFNNSSLFLCFKRENIIPDISSRIDTKLLNINMPTTITKYVNNMFNIVNKMNLYMIENRDKNFYIWPASVHSVTLFTFGLDYKKLLGILDNSPNKVGKYQYGYNLKCDSFYDIIKNGDENIVIFISGAGQYISEIRNMKTNVKILYMDDFCG